MFNKGLIITNAFANYAQVENMVARLVEEFSLKGIAIDHKTNSEILCFIQSDGSIKVQDLPYDFIVYLDKDYYIAKMLEKAGYRLFNKADSIRLCDDKILTHITLANNNIKMPRTIAFPLKYVEGSKEKFISNLIKEIEFPFVVKEAYGSLGAQVYLVSNLEELLKLEDKLENRPHLYQELIKSSYGKDMRIIVVGHKVVASMKREANSQDEFRSNIELGGHGSNPILSEEFKKEAEKISCLLDLDYCGLDLLFGENDLPILCEVNANAFIKGIEHYTNVNVAVKYVEYIISQIYG